MKRSILHICILLSAVFLCNTKMLAWGENVSYLLNSTSKYEGVLGSHSFKNSDLLSRSNLGVYISAGFNTWNLYGYYGFKPLYNKNTIDTASHINMLNVGLMFYIL